MSDAKDKSKYFIPWEALYIKWFYLIIYFTGNVEFSAVEIATILQNNPDIWLWSQQKNQQVRIGLDLLYNNQYLRNTVYSSNAGWKENNTR
jgi:hypothetical protein